ncbi:MAG TPA: Na+/H+ antiporter, partial [Flavobacteriales bacterium]|nr:Na+/H+ antiporter [Flavobacteriales bacterium]
MPLLAAFLHERLFLVLLLLFIIAVLHMLSARLHISYPIVLVLGGLGISLIPGMPLVQLDPELVFVIFLPPLLYEAAWTTSWRDFWKWRRPIGLLAFGLVFFTSSIVAVVAHAMIPGFSLAMGFLLGGIISPPDAVAATSILQGLRVPKRVVTILEGESLVNDASSLIVFRFAVAAILTGQFALVPAIGNFFWVAGMGIVVGLAIAYIIYWIHKLLPTTSSIDVALTIMSPYLMYLAAEELHVSGIMAVVCGGLFLSYRSSEFMNYRARIQGYSVWETLSFLLNGFVFILIGLQLPVITADLDMPPLPALIYAVVISLLTIVVRFIWVFPATYIPRFLSKRIRERERRPSLKAVLLVAWAGMRGVVSLASALAIPLSLTDGSAFPYRNFILFITFMVILITLVLQGLTLPRIIAALDLPVEDTETEHERHLTRLQARMAKAALHHLDTHYKEQVEGTEAFVR